MAAYNSAGLGVYSSKVTEWTLQGGGCFSQSQVPRDTGGLGGAGGGGGWTEGGQGRGFRGAGKLVQFHINFIGKQFAFSSVTENLPSTPTSITSL